MAYEPTDWLACPPEVLSRILDGEAVILHLGSGTYFGMNEVGSRAWERLQSGTTFGALLSSLLSEFEVSEEELRRDLTVFVDDLVLQNLIRVNDRAPG